jgi:predicted MFS family arabinose efflux permease
MIAAERSRPNSVSLWMVAGLAMGPAVALGLARFAYALLLPSMRAELDWSYANAGAMNTANAVGYLVGALLAAPLARRYGAKQTFLAGILVTALAIGAAGLTADFSGLMALRVVAGAMGALAFVAGGAMTAAAGGTPSRAPVALGIYFAGGGIGIAISALTVPIFLDTIGWRGGWLALGGLALLCSLISLPALRLAPLPALQSAARTSVKWPLKRIAIELCGYVLFGAGYIAYATFIIAHLRSAASFTSFEISIFWALLGLAAVAGVFAWSPLLTRLQGGRGAAATIVVVALGAALPLLSSGRPAAYLSAILFGSSFLSVITAVTSFARRAAPPEAWTRAIAALTVAFGTGQCVGPMLSGYLSDGPNGVRLGLQLSVWILMASALIIAMQREAPSYNAG